jgi:hypothetical protein
MQNPIAGPTPSKTMPSSPGWTNSIGSSSNNPLTPPCSSQKGVWWQINRYSPNCSMRKVKSVSWNISYTSKCSTTYTTSIPRPPSLDTSISERTQQYAENASEKERGINRPIYRSVIWPKFMNCTRSGWAKALYFKAPDNSKPAKKL